MCTSVRAATRRYRCFQRCANNITTTTVHENMSQIE